MPAEGEIIANRFQLVRELGRGSMGSVWLAHHLTLEVPCAVKFIASDATNEPSFRARFHIEARTIAQLKSPNVVRVLDHDVSDGCPAYIAMEFLEGEDLWSHLQRVGRLDANATYAIISQVARGLSRAHAAGIIHRDLKPENVFLAYEGDEKVVKLLDFGIAKWTSSSLFDEADGLVGTPEYMSPEQARGRLDTDYRSDLWSLAVVAYQCMTGQLPFSGATTAEIFAHIAVGSIPVPSEVAAGVSADFDRWWTQATSRTIERRFQSASELSNALGEALGITETRRQESKPPRGAVATSPVLEARLPSLDNCVTQCSRPPPPVRRRRRTRFPASVVGVIAAIIAMLVVAGHDKTSVARANLADRRSAAVESPLFAHLAAARVEGQGDAALQPVASTAVAAKPPQRVLGPERPIVRSLRSPRVAGSARVARPAGEVLPKTDAPPKAEEIIPKTEALPQRDEGAVDFGI